MALITNMRPFRNKFLSSLPLWAFDLQINLVAAQLIMDREHNNRIVFDGQEGLDPMVDLSLRGAQIRALIQGRASTWHRHLLLTPITAPAGEAVSLHRISTGLHLQCSTSKYEFPLQAKFNHFESTFFAGNQPACYFIVCLDISKSIFQGLKDLAQILQV